MSKLGIDNLVTVSIDAILIGRDVKDQLDDGFQPFTDIPTIAFKNFGKIQEVAAVAPQAGREILDLTPDELEEYEVRVSAATGLPNTGIAGKARKSLRYVARVYRWGVDGVDIFHDGVDLVAEIRA